MRDVAILSFAQSKLVSGFGGNEIELLLPVVRQAVEHSGLSRAEIGFSTLASSDFMAGQAFSFVRALDAMGVYPVADDSHVDMDGAFALYEAWVRLQVGDVDAALVVALGRSTSGRLAEIAPLALDPYYLAPLGIDPLSLAALQARVLIERGVCDQAAIARVAEKNHRWARANPFALDRPLRALTEEPLPSPLCALDCAPLADGAVAMVIANEATARRVCERPVWIRGLDHRVDAHSPGARDLTRAASARSAAERARAHEGAIDVAELTSVFAHEEILLARELGLEARTRINPSGGPFAGNPVMATGLIRVGEAFAAIARGEAQRALAHATSGPCLQQNLIAILEADRG